MLFVVIEIAMRDSKFSTYSLIAMTIKVLNKFFKDHVRLPIHIRSFVRTNVSSLRQPNVF